MTNFFTKNKKNDEPITIEEEIPAPFYPTDSDDQDSIITADNTNWEENTDTDGQLSVDVYQTKDDLVIKSTIAGVKPENIDISIDNDVLTVRGERKMEEKIIDEDYFYQECYWGNFSRSIVLPVEVKTDEVEASLKNGVLTVILPKSKKNKSIAVKVKSE
ncbi:MAG TPA: Hsp20/alpha crystallin family protein [bacterium]|nr:Hsp20/alpha crystallin family protein [bacterium]